MTVATDAALRYGVSDDVLVVDRDGQVEAASPRLCQHFGWRSVELERRSLFMILDPSDAMIHARCLDWTLSGLESHEYRSKARTAGGDFRPVRVRMRRLDDSGVPRVVVSLRCVEWHEHVPDGVLRAPTPCGDGDGI